MKKDSVYLQHILNSIWSIESYLTGITFLDFVKNEEKQDAVIRKIQVIGEASKKVSAGLKSRFPEVP